MPKRLTRIYTRTGDDGDTSLADGPRLHKDAPRIEALGSVDELNSLIGLLLADAPPEPVSGHLTRVQHELFELGAELSQPGVVRLSERHWTRLEEGLDFLNNSLEPLEEFILPGGTRGAAACHVARAVCRRAERRLVALSHDEVVNQDALRYLNRLSDLLFVTARILNRAAGRQDARWQPESG